MQAADLERFFNLEPAGVKGLFKEAFASLQELVKQDEPSRTVHTGRKRWSHAELTLSVGAAAPEMVTATSVTASTTAAAVAAYAHLYTVRSAAAPAADSGPPGQKPCSHAERH